MAGMEQGDPAYDWVDDDELSAEETLRRFAALSPTRVGVTAGEQVAAEEPRTAGGASKTFTEQLWPGKDLRELLVS
jgi:hypothetical protein